MRISAFAVAALSTIAVASATTKTSKYTYKPGGELIDGKFLPGPEAWGGQCNNGSTEQTPVAIVDEDTEPAPSEITTADYTLDGGTCTFKDVIYGVEDNGVKVSFPSDCAPSFTMPNTEELVGLGVNGNLDPSLTIGAQTLGPEAGKSYKAAQFHIHTKSEHTVDGATFDLEMHIVHLATDVYGDIVNVPLLDEEELATQLNSAAGIVGGVLGTNPRPASVVGFLLKGGGSANPMIEEFLVGWEAAGCGAKTHTSLNFKDTAFNVYDLLAADTCIWNYDGGLTTPGCDEIVEWNLATTPVMISTNQKNRLYNLINGCKESISWADSTSRPVQPLNGRTINKICPARRRKNLRA